MRAITYKEFDNKYNKRDNNGVITECCVINLEGQVIFSGSINRVYNWWDENAEIIWKKDKFVGFSYNCQEIITTNIDNNAYGRYIFSKLTFKVSGNE